MLLEIKEIYNFTAKAPKNTAATSSKENVEFKKIVCAFVGKSIKLKKGEPF